jgi:photosystem II stability/assembly factor-like uncharacterized protein
MKMWSPALGLLAIANVCWAQWMPQQSGTGARLRGLSVVNGEIAWASGQRGTCLRTVNGGNTWVARHVPGSSELDFRDIHAVDAERAFVLSIGPGDRSRIYRTTDGGATWVVQFQSGDPRIFLDAIAFWDADHGLALGDPIDGRFVILATGNGGGAWERMPDAGVPPALPGEGAFAASGTCLVVDGNGNAWFGTGGASVARVFRSTDRGRTWTAAATPLRAGTASSGIFSLAFHDDGHGIAMGSDYKKPEEPGRSVARTHDGGQTWALSTGSQPGGYRSCVAYVPGRSGPCMVAVGPTGTDVSTDGGENWQTLGSTGFDAVALTAPDAGFAVGDLGRIAGFRGIVTEGAGKPDSRGRPR